MITIEIIHVNCIIIIADFCHSVDSGLQILKCTHMYLDNWITIMADILV